MSGQLSLFDTSSQCRQRDPITSIESAADIQPKLTGLRAEFVERLCAIGEPSTANEIAAGDESIRKRAKECERMGLVTAYDVRQCRVTGKRATVYWVR